jgi:hypothetical protein
MQFETSGRASLAVADAFFLEREDQEAAIRGRTLFN